MRKILIFVLLFFCTFGFSQEKKLKKPRLSIITSLYNGQDFIEGYLKDLTEQTIFSDCELIIIDANSPGKEDTFIRKYMKKHSNIIYVRLDKDPGQYECWNMAIKMASSDLLTNANLDDRSKNDAYAQHVKYLEEHPDIDLVYAEYYITNYANETFEKNRYRWVTTLKDFSLKDIWRCSAGPRPVWRKSVHDRYGYFDTSFVYLADWEMWIRAATKGAKYQKIPGVYTLFYNNPKGLTCDQDRKKKNKRIKERNRIVMTYDYLWKDQWEPKKDPSKAEAKKAQL